MMMNDEGFKARRRGGAGGILCALFTLWLCVSIGCASAPAAQPQVAQTPPPPPPVVNPDTLPAGEEALAGLEASRARAQAAREASLAVQAQNYFADEWNAAEAKSEDGKNTPVETLGQVKQAMALFTGAADGWEAITARSEQLIAANKARAAWEAAYIRVEQSRKKAQDNKGDSYFPDDWKSAEDLRRQGDNATKPVSYRDSDEGTIVGAVEEDAVSYRDSDEGTVVEAPRPAISFRDSDTGSVEAPPATTEQFIAAAALYTQAANGYDSIATKSIARIAAEQEDAKKRAADEAKRAADAQKALAAAQARADKSRQATMDVDGQNYFANDWKSAETKLQGAKNAKKGTTDEIVAATTLFTQTADAYDAITNKAKTQFARDKDAATKALRDAITRMQKSRTDVTTAKGDTAFANEWRAAEAKNQTAAKAKQATIAEMKAATPLYNAAADAYDDIVKKNSVRANAANAVAKAKEKSEKSAAFARTTASALATEEVNAQ